MIQNKVAIVTGGNRGIGLALCSKLAKMGYRVVMSGRKKKEIDNICKPLIDNGLDVYPVELDVSSSDSISKAIKLIIRKYQTIDILINNAAVYYDNPRNITSDMDLLRIDHKLFEQTMKVNLYGPFMLMQRIVPLMIQNNHGRIVNISSGLSRLEDIDHRGAFYRISKTSLNALTIAFASLVKEHNILINSVCPGWVKTDMGGNEAVRSIDQAINGIIWAATLKNDGPSGKFFRDGFELDWNRK